MKRFVFMIHEKKAILVVDDDAAICRVLKRILERRGFYVDTCETGAAASEKLGINLYDVALIDLRLPDMDGTDLFGQMNEVEPKMVKIVLTGLPYVENDYESLEGGADAFLSKPVDPEFLLSLIEDKIREKNLDLPVPASPSILIRE